MDNYAGSKPEDVFLLDCQNLVSEPLESMPIKMSDQPSRICVLRMGGAKLGLPGVVVRGLPFRIGTGEDADLLVGDAGTGEVCCALEEGVGGGLDLRAVRGVGVTINGKALGEGEQRPLSRDDIVEIVGGGLHFSAHVQNVRVVADAQERVGTGEEAPSGEAGGWERVDAAVQCPICIETMHRCAALFPCLHSMCAGCASKVLATSDRCPTCRAPVSGACPNLSMRGVIEGICEEGKGRKRDAEEVEELDMEERALAGHVSRIKRQRRGISVVETVVAGNVEGAREGLQRGADVEERLGRGQTFLFFAAAAGWVGMVQMLLAAGAEPGELVEEEEEVHSALQIAVVQGHLGVVRALLGGGADVNQEGSDGRSALILANATENATAIVCELLACGAAVDQTDEYGRTALCMACLTGSGDVELIKLLIGAGADLGVVVRGGVFEGRTPLQLACNSGYIGVVQELLAAAVDVDQTGGEERTALMWAAARGEVEIVQMLVKAKADVNRVDSAGGTSLVLSSERGHLEVVRALLNAGADVGKTCEDTPQELCPLMVAANRGFSEVVQALLGAGADVKQTADGGTFALLLGASGGDVPVVRALLRAGADVQQADARGVSALMAASRNHRLEVVVELLGAGAEVNQVDSDGLSALMYVSGGVQVARALLRAGAEVKEHSLVSCLHEHCSLVRDELDKAAEAVIHEEDDDPGVICGSVAAAYAGHVEVLRELMGAGAGMHSVWGGEQTPVLLACISSHSEVLNMLEEGGLAAHPMCAVCAQGHLAVVRVLLGGAEGGAWGREVQGGGGGAWGRDMQGGAGFVNKADKEGCSPLMAACEAGNLEGVRALLAVGADVTRVDAKGVSALMLASGKGRVGVVTALLAAIKAAPGDARVEVNKADAQGRSALLWASFAEQNEVYAALFGAGADMKQKDNEGWGFMLIPERFGGRALRV